MKYQIDTLLKPIKIIFVLLCLYLVYYIFFISSQSFLFEAVALGIGWQSCRKVKALYLSYNDKADITNDSNSYESTKKYIKNGLLAVFVYLGFRLLEFYWNPDSFSIHLIIFYMILIPSLFRLYFLVKNLIHQQQ